MDVVRVTVTESGGTDQAQLSTLKRALLEAKSDEKIARKVECPTRIIRPKTALDTAPCHQDDIGFHTVDGEDVDVSQFLLDCSWLLDCYRRRVILSPTTATAEGRGQANSKVAGVDFVEFPFGEHIYQTHHGQKNPTFLGKSGVTASCESTTSAQRKSHNLPPIIPKSGGTVVEPHARSKQRKSVNKQVAYAPCFFSNGAPTSTVVDILSGSQTANQTYPKDSVLAARSPLEKTSKNWSNPDVRREKRCQGVSGKLKGNSMMGRNAHYGSDNELKHRIKHLVAYNSSSELPWEHGGSSPELTMFCSRKPQPPFKSDVPPTTTLSRQKSQSLYFQPHPPPQPPRRSNLAARSTGSLYTKSLLVVPHRPTSPPKSLAAFGANNKLHGSCTPSVRVPKARFPIYSLGSGSDNVLYTDSKETESLRKCKSLSNHLLVERFATDSKFKKSDK